MSAKDIEIGPQSASDNAFAKRMRQHQSWYRANILKLPCGVGPAANATNHYGNMLRAEDGKKGLNFFSPEIHRVAQERLAENKGTVKPYRLMNNMLSSQPMCFNLFGPMVRDLTLATQLMKSILPEIAEVTRVVIEYAPTPESEYLNDRTAFDAFVEYRRTDGHLSFVGIETKLTERFSPKHYDRDEYRRWMDKPTSAWRPDAADQVAAVQHNQLWRDHLLAVAMNQHPNSPYTEGKLMLVAHPGDMGCVPIVSNYQALLKDDDSSFVDMPLDQLIAKWLDLDGLSDEVEAWLKAFSLRYLELNASGS